LISAGAHSEAMDGHHLLWTLSGYVIPLRAIDVLEAQIMVVETNFVGMESHLLTLKKAHPGALWASSVWRCGGQPAMEDHPGAL
jgi:hypothetical protein